MEKPEGGEVFVGSTYDENEASEYYDRSVKLEEYYQSDKYKEDLAKRQQRYKQQEEEEALRERDKQDAEELGMDAANETDDN